MAEVRVCFGCNENILEGVQFLRVGGRVYHNNHFVCAHCGDKFGGKSYYEQDGQPYCEKDYQALFMPRCEACGLPISGDVMDALGAQFHPACFKCSRCSRSLDEGDFYADGKKPLCSDCHLPKCAGCGRTVEGEYLKAMELVFHPTCFNCSVCHEAFPSGKYFSEDGKAYCAKHFYERKGVVCVVCSQPMTDQFIEIENLKYHLEHFTCHFCKTPLITEPNQDVARIKKKEGKYACNKCSPDA